MSEKPDVDRETGFMTFENLTNGRTWTLTTRLGQMLTEAEELYGPRMAEFTPIGIEFAPEKTPRIWIHGISQVCVQLTYCALRDWDEAIYELSHEVVHLLAPKTGPANAIEEGAAVHFALTRTHYNDFGFPNRCRTAIEQDKRSSYAQPLKDYETLMGMDPEAIKKIRVREPSFSKVTADIIREAVPQCSSELAERLCASG